MDAPDEAEAAVDPKLQRPAGLGKRLLRVGNFALREFGWTFLMTYNIRAGVGARRELRPRRLAPPPCSLPCRNEINACRYPMPARDARSARALPPHPLPRPRGQGAGRAVHRAAGGRAAPHVPGGRSPPCSARRRVHRLVPVRARRAARARRSRGGAALARRGRRRRGQRRPGRHGSGAAPHFRAVRCGAGAAVPAGLGSGPRRVALLAGARRHGRLLPLLRLHHVRLRDAPGDATQVVQRLHRQDRPHSARGAAGRAAQLQGPAHRHSRHAAALPAAGAGPARRGAAARPPADHPVLGAAPADALVSEAQPGRADARVQGHPAAVPVADLRARRRLPDAELHPQARGCRAHRAPSPVRARASPPLPLACARSTAR